MDKFKRTAAVEVCDGYCPTNYRRQVDAASWSSLIISFVVLGEGATNKVTQQTLRRLIRSARAIIYLFRRHPRPKWRLKAARRSCENIPLCSLRQEQSITLPTFGFMPFANSDARRFVLSRNYIIRLWRVGNCSKWGSATIIMRKTYCSF